jgi:hypothetical protein
VRANAEVREEKAMSTSIRSLIQEHHAFYEVLPYYEMVQTNGGDSSASQKIQAGFDVYIYGVNIGNHVEMPHPEEYALGHAELRKILEEISCFATDSCVLELFSFPSTVIFDVRDHGKVEVMLRVRISHCRGLDQPVGPAEEHALEEIKRRLESIGVVRR